jgi:hypothetical protein
MMELRWKPVDTICSVFSPIAHAIKDPPITQRKTDARHADICIDRTFRISYEDQTYFINDIHIVLGHIVNKSRGA